MHLHLKIRILFIHFLFLVSEGGTCHSGPLRTLVQGGHVGHCGIMTSLYECFFKFTSKERIPVFDHPNQNVSLHHCSKSF